MAPTHFDDYRVWCPVAPRLRQSAFAVGGVRITFTSKSFPRTKISESSPFRLTRPPLVASADRDVF